jgi:hypothetical protein
VLLDKQHCRNDHRGDRARSVPPQLVALLRCVKPAQHMNGDLLVDLIQVALAGWLAWLTLL